MGGTCTSHRELADLKVFKAKTFSVAAALLVSELLPVQALLVEDTVHPGWYSILGCPLPVFCKELHHCTIMASSCRAA